MDNAARDIARAVPRVERVGECQGGGGGGVGVGDVGGVGVGKGGKEK